VTPNYTRTREACVRLNNDLGTLEDPEVCYILTLVPTATATGGICTNGIGSDSDPCQGNTPTPNPTVTPTPPTLTDFGIEFEGIWSDAEKVEVLMAAIETGTALSSLRASSNLVEAFRTVLQGTNATGAWRSIVFSRATNSGAFCITNPTPNSSTQIASISCDTRVVMNLYTAVHEFGHIFSLRTGNVFRSNVEYPNGSGQLGLRIGNVNVLGYRSYTGLVGGDQTDWQRSDVLIDNGWGDAALWDGNYRYRYDFATQVPDQVGLSTPTPTPRATALPVFIPAIGPCNTGSPTDLPIVNANFFPFQQNPCTFPNWIVSDVSTGKTVEIEEAVADMFLNWVFWKNSQGQEGFQNELWRGGTCYPNGCNDPANSGNVRSAWMDATMIQLFVTFSW